MSCASTESYNHSWPIFHGDSRITMNVPLKKSTTLFPMRIKEVMNSVSDKVKDRHIHRNGSSAKDREKSKVNKKSIPVSTNTASYGNGVNSDNYPVQSVDIDNSSPSTSKSYNEKEITADHIPRFVKCFICERIIKEDHFSEHLLFGAVKCLLCNAQFRDCQSFQVWATQYALGNVSCNHDFYYLTKCSSFLMNKFLAKHPINNTRKHQLVLLKNYINKLISLERKRPWQQAISECKDVIANEEYQCSEVKEVVGLIKDKCGISRNIGNSSKNFSNDEGYESSRIQEEYLDDEFAQYYDLNQLEKATEFVKVSETIAEYEVPETVSTAVSKSSESMPNKHSSTNKLKAGLKNAVCDHTDLDAYEKLKNKTGSNQTNRTGNTRSDQAELVGDKRKTMTENDEVLDQTDDVVDADLEYVPIPSDGFYYVSTEPIEECPNCYEMLCPSQFTVNVLTFLMTVICVGCDLTIYITSGAPEVQIVTGGMEEEESEPSMVENSVKYNPPGNKSKKRGRPKKYPKLV